MYSKPCFETAYLGEIEKYPSKKYPNVRNLPNLVTLLQLHIALPGASIG
jgi:hypothetical protein